MKLYSVYQCSLCLVILIAISEPRELRYALFTSGPDGGFDSSGIIPAMELAEEEIFNDPSVLEGFRLTRMPVEDTMVRQLHLESTIKNEFYSHEPQCTRPSPAACGCGCCIHNYFIRLSIMTDNSNCHICMY